MKIAIMQPYFFPYIGYFQLISAVDKFVIYDDVNYIKGGYINRNSIYEKNKGRQYINLVLDKASPNKLIKDISLNQQNIWKDKLLKQISQNYSKAPYFKSVFPIIESIIYSPELNLSLFLHHSIKCICDYLGIETEIISTSEHYNNKGIGRFERIVDICGKENCSEYINPIGGVELYHKDEFRKYNIDLFFLKTNTIEYKQFDNEFEPFLSIIDIMMFNSVEKIQDFLKMYKVV
ncbi:WbqC-like protein family [Phocoenobacter uteri]|uniref:WbqC-like protein family n=1 Tax=Phocoenobacter uteri TaxID=146806 RepID=A0A379CAF7_9PAST|nr:WbqC family protein [Phocoenobacter uteri]MDG6881127.1 hypothetical protein [Phocoenobacter uteri]SUB59149.1 WbqC-like protein family [Phocoenobacter uteri]